MNLGSAVLLLHARGELGHCDLELCYKRRLADSEQSRLRPDPQAHREGVTVDKHWEPGCNAYRGPCGPTWYLGGGETSEFSLKTVKFWCNLVKQRHGKFLSFSRFSPRE
jgi:hypothetical protein